LRLLIILHIGLVSSKATVPYMAWDKKAVAGRDPAYWLGAVVVASHSRERAVGDVVDITLPQDEATKV
jgi:hypothetical protein